MGRWSKMVAPELVRFARLPERGTILDVGSGTGSLSSAIVESASQRRVVGIDPSKEYVAYAASKNAAGERARFEVGDAQKLSFADGTFEGASSLLVFNFIPDPAKAIGEVRRVTKATGPISAATWDYSDGMKMLRVFWDAAVAIDPRAEKLDEKHMRLCRSGELSKLWREAGLENVAEQPLTIPMQFHTFADYWDPFLLGQGPAGAYVKSLTADRVAALRGRLKSALASNREDQAFRLEARVWAVRGTVPKAR